MTNEDKILSMLDVIAEQVTKLTEISATKDDIQSVKDELRSFKEQTNDRFNKIDERFNRIDDRFDKFEAEPSAAHEAILAKIDDQSELLEARFDVLNDRLFTQETQLKLLKKKEAL